MNYVKVNLNYVLFMRSEAPAAVNMKSLVTFYKTAWCHIQEGNNQHIFP